LIEKVIKKCNESENKDDRGDYPYFILLRDPYKHPNDFTSIEEVDRYINTMPQEFTADWSVFETYLRKRLVFRT